MVYFRPGSHVRRLVTILAVTGEIPVKALALLGSQRVYRALVTRLCEEQTFVNSETGEKLTCRLLTLHGKGGKKSIRFYKAGLLVLNWIGAYDSYMRAFWNHNFPSDDSHVDRNFRFSEAVILCMRAGAEIRPWQMRALQKQSIQRQAFSRPALYSAKAAKNTQEGDLCKTQYARFIAALFTSDHAYVLYNVRNAVMKWNGMSECKTVESIAQLARMNSTVPSVDSAIIFGNTEDVAIRTIEDLRKKRRMELRLDAVYRHIYFVPLSEGGLDQLRLLLLPDWNERMLAVFFTSAERSFNQGAFEYDAVVDGAYIFVFLDGDIARLNRFAGAVRDGQKRCELLCFPFQVGLAKQVVGDTVDITTVAPSVVLSTLGAGKEDDL